MSDARLLGRFAKTRAPLLLQLSSFRFWDEREAKPKPPSRLHWLFNLATEDDFKREVRVTRAKFNVIGNLIRDHRRFAELPGRGRRQAPLRVQLAVALYRFGMNGNAASVDQIAIHFSIGGMCVGESVECWCVDGCVPAACNYLCL